MASKKETLSDPNLELLQSAEALQEQLGKTESFARSNQNLILGVVGGILILVAGFFSYQWYIQSQEEEAQVEMFPAIFYLEKDSLNKAIEGDGRKTTIGLKAIAEDYSGTKAGTLAQFYIGVARLKQGKFDQAIEALEDFNANDYLIQARTYSLLGDAYLEKSDLASAIKYYQKAADYKANEQFTPGYLLKLGLAQELNKDSQGALKTYQLISEKYAESTEFVQAEKLIAKLGYSPNK